jgi:hypothetical protein
MILVGGLSRRARTAEPGTDGVRLFADAEDLLPEIEQNPEIEILGGPTDERRRGVPGGRQERVVRHEHLRYVRRQGTKPPPEVVDLGQGDAPVLPGVGRAVFRPWTARRP